MTTPDSIRDLAEGTVTLEERLARMFAAAQGKDPDAPYSATKPAPSWMYETDEAETAIREVLAAQTAAAADWYTTIRSDGHVLVQAHQPALDWLRSWAEQEGLAEPPQSPQETSDDVA